MTVSAVGQAVGVQETGHPSPCTTPLRAQAATNKLKLSETLKAKLDAPAASTATVNRSLGETTSDTTLPRNLDGPYLQQQQQSELDSSSERY